MNKDATDMVIEVDHVTRTFKRKRALDDVSLHVPRGCVFGLLGENGAGKTTLINHLLGSYMTQAGRVRVLGNDPAQEPEKTLARIGYLSEDRIMPSWMTVAELIKFTRAFYPNWDPAFAEELRDMFHLDPAARVKTLSKGERAKAELLTALAHRPELLILDEPSSGLDVIVRQEILRAIVRDVVADGRTVFFSSHLLDEVERVSDYIAIMANGRVILADTLDNIRDNHWRMTIRYPMPRHAAPEFNGALSCHGAGHLWTVICNGEREAIRGEVERDEGAVVDEQPPTLEEVFVARTRGAGQTAAAPAQAPAP